MSYTYKDEKRIEQIVSKLQQVGCNIWYYEGILPVDEWAETIGKKLANAILYFLVLSKNIPILTYFLKDVPLSESLELQFGLTQAVHSSHDIKENCDKIHNIFPKKAMCDEKPKINVLEGHIKRKQNKFDPNNSIKHREPLYDVWFANDLEE